MILFKSKKQKKAESQAIVAEIHEAFDTAQERLLNEAKKVLESTIISNEKKAERLASLGFVNSKLVDEFIEKKDIHAVHKADADLIMYYKDNYPFLKFLTENELEKICKKYNLIYAPISAYQEDVPDKNLDDIENAQALNKEDSHEAPFFLSTDEKGFYKKCPKSLRRIFTKGFYVPKKAVRWDSYDREFQIGRESAIDLARKYGGYKGKYNGWVFTRVLDVSQEDRTGLFIAAPKSHFKLDKLSKNKSGYFEVKTMKIKPDDPIVFRYVKGGIQVITKWGLEASDPALQLDIDN